MKVRNAVKDYQRRLADLDADYSRARDRLEAAVTRRAKVIEEQDQIVAGAQREVEDAIAAMAQDAGVALTASLLDLEPARVRRLTRQGRSQDGRAEKPGRSKSHAEPPGS